MIRKIPKLFKVVSGLQKTPSLCSSLYLQLFKFASSSDTGSIVSVMLRERRDSASLGRCFSGWSPQRRRWPLWQVSGCKESKGDTPFPSSPFPLPFHFQFLPHYSASAYTRWNLSISLRIKM